MLFSFISICHLPSILNHIFLCIGRIYWNKLTTVRAIMSEHIQHTQKFISPIWRYPTQLWVSLITDLYDLYWYILYTLMDRNNQVKNLHWMCYYASSFQIMYYTLPSFNQVVVLSLVSTVNILVSIDSPFNINRISILLLVHRIKILANVGNLPLQKSSHQDSYLVLDCG